MILVFIRSKYLKKNEEIFFFFILNLSNKLYLYNIVELLIFIKIYLIFEKNFIFQLIFYKILFNCIFL